MWSELGVNDLLYVGGDLMKIKELPTHPDADCIFFSAKRQRSKHGCTASNSTGCNQW